MIELDRLKGHQVDGRFELERLIGRGASGVVYRAQDTTGRLVALKLVQPANGVDRTSARYLRGTRLASQLQHPHIVRVLESGRWGPRRRCYYLAMELVEGVPLGLIRHAGLSPEQAVALIRQVLEAAVYVHARDTVHRDLKPDNVMVTRLTQGLLHCQVTDFGIASNRIQDTPLTLQGTVVGTPAYMAPEQAEGLPSIGPTVDLYAIGVMLYELLCGQLPFTGSVQALLYQKVNQDPPLLSNSALLPSGLTEVVMRMIARRPEGRFSHARDILLALEPFFSPPVLSEDAWLNLRDLVYVDPPSIQEHATTVDAELAPKRVVPEAARPEFSTWTSEPVRTRLWGRDALLEHLETHVRTVEAGVAQIVLLTGGFGVGKSSLMDVLAIRLQEEGRFQVLRTAFSATSPLQGGLRGAVEQSLGVRGRSAQTVLRAVQEHLRRTAEADPDEAESLSRWLRPPRDGTSGTIAAATPDFSPGLRYLRRLSRSRPVLLLVDDLHQGGSRAAALIEYLLFEMDFEPCDLMVMGAVVSGELGADFKEGLIRSSHAEGRNRHIVQVPSLPNPAIIRGLRQDLQLSTARAERIAERAGGNPLIARGLAQESEQDSVLTDRWEVGSSETQRLESTLNAMLQRMLHSLFSTAEAPNELRDMIQALAILGTEVDVEMLADFLGIPVDDLDFEARLDLLIERNMVVELQSEGQDQVGLRPQVLAQVVLAELGRRQQRRMHQRAIRILEDSDSVDPGVLGDHHLALGQINAAIDCWKRAETRALLAGAPFTAADWGQKLITQLSEPERSIWRVRLGRVLLDAGDPRRAEQILRPVADSGQTDLSLLASDVLCDVYENLGKGDEWTELAHQVEALLPKAARTGRHAAFCALAMWRTAHGDDGSGRIAAESAVEISESSVEVRRAAQRLAFSCLPSLSLDTAGEAAERALEASGTHPQLRARSLRTLGVVRMWQGRGDDAADLHEQALALARWKGLSSRAALALQDLGDALRVAGRYPAAQERYASSIQAAEALDLGSTVYLVRFKQLMCEIALSQDSDMVARLQALSEPATAAGLALARPFSYLLIAWFCARKGQTEEARMALGRASLLEGFQVDPQVPAIFKEIRSLLQGGQLL